MFVKHRFKLSEITQDLIRSVDPPFGYNGAGELVYYSRYSRIKKDGGQENWHDTIIRVLEGVFSIRKDWYIKNHINWDQNYWQNYARNMALSVVRMKWMPPGRGLWAMGTDFVYERGSMSLYNCSATYLTDAFGSDCAWAMDCLMNGVGVGFGIIRNDKMELYQPKGEYDFIIQDTRESWVECTGAIIDSFIYPNSRLPRPIYDLIRPAGMPIKGFGGIASGPGPLIELHEQIIECLNRYRENKAYDSVRLKLDIANMIGCCVVAGNVRRSAELASCSVNDPVFMDLKNYDLYPDRIEHGWMANLSVDLESDDDFLKLGEIAKRVPLRGEPGYKNLQNFPFGRIGKSMKGLRRDVGKLLNPCGEIVLEHREVCNVDETLPTMCNTVEEWYESCDFATFYCSTVSLLPTQQPTTNRVVARNRRIGVSIIDVAGWVHAEGVHRVTKYLRKGYDVVRNSNHLYNSEAGVPDAIRCTTEKPGGTVPKLPGKTPGIGSPTFDYTIRRFRQQENSPIDKILTEAGYPREKDKYSANTVVFEVPILQGPSLPAAKISLWEQAMMLVLMQREWADNAVSNTLYFKPRWPLVLTTNDPEKVKAILENDSKSTGYIEQMTKELRSFNQDDKFRLTITYDIGTYKPIEFKLYEYDPNHEEHHIEPVLSCIAPLTKSVALLPHSGKGAYEQMPEEGTTREDYEYRLRQIKPIDWSEFKGSDGADDKYCEGPSCSVQ